MSLATPTLDVRTIPPVERHRQIFDRLAGLAAGDAIVVVNDHDPVPLQFQLERQWPGQFGFSYLEAGPEVWKLEVRKTVPAEAAGSCCSGGRCCG